MTGVYLWWKGPTWLADPEEWPPNIVKESSTESRAERKVQQELFAGAVEESNDLIISSKSSACVKPGELVLGSRDSHIILDTLPTRSRDL